jgi:MarR family transcriptional regulator, lower aerobic nicotinate degradation pathway regulator
LGSWTNPNISMIAGLVNRQSIIYSLIMIVSAINKIEAALDKAEQSGWIGFLLNQAAMRIRTITVMALSPLGLTPPQLRALEAIEKEQPLSQTRLGELVNMDRSTIVHVVDHFEALGAASREADPSDRRSHAVVLTQKGQDLLVEAQRQARAVEEEFLSPLSRPEREALRDLLHKLFDPSPCPEEKKRESCTPPPHPR